MKPFIIGIAGGSASGKTTFTQQLIVALNERKIKVFHMDDYFKSDQEREIVKSPITKKEYRDDNHPLSFNLDQLYEDIKNIKEDFKIIIIEGLLTLYDEKIYSCLDLKLFIDCRADERILRRLKRNMKRGLSFDEISNVYLDLVRFRHDEFVENSRWKADLIVNGAQSFEMPISIIKKFIL